MDELFWEIQITLGQGAVMTVPKPIPPSEKPPFAFYRKEIGEIRCPRCGLYPRNYMGKWSCNCQVYEP